MDNIVIELSHDYYEAEEVDETIVIKHLFLHKNFIIFLFYLLLEFIDGPSLEFTQIPRKFIISGEPTFIRLSKKLKLETDGDFKVLFNQQGLRRWLYGAAIPLLLLLIFFTLLLAIILVFLITSKLSLASIILFVVMVIVVSFFSYANLLLLKQYNEYKSIDQLIRNT